MDLEKRTKAIAELGKFIQQFDGKAPKSEHALNSNFYADFQQLIQRAQEHNGWFLPAEIEFTLGHWGNLLNENNLAEWTKGYNLNPDEPKTIAVITAGNIPLVGLHDCLSVLVSGHKLLVKTSSKDQLLLPYLLQLLQVIEPEFKHFIQWSKSELKGMDAVIATGSGNSARYFDHYFAKFPHIIRKNRNSVAVITGEESEEDLTALGEDVFRYFGLGCRSVSKVFVPRNYDLNHIFKGLYPYKSIIENKKYENNYDYNKAVYLMSQFDLVENGFLMMKEDSSYASPIATLFYEYYDSLQELKSRLEADRDQLQCIVACTSELPEAIPFGTTQVPALNQYADHIDTLKFLTELN